jgi:hypothetical protein
MSAPNVNREAIRKVAIWLQPLYLSPDHTYALQMQELITGTWDHKGNDMVLHQKD